MRELQQKLIEALLPIIKPRPLWAPVALTIGVVSKFYNRLAQQRAMVLRREEAGRLAREKFPDLIVRHGPFKGLRFQSEYASFGCLLAKLLGSYERELHPAIEEIIGADYDYIVDVGSAEGYYAVGLARRCARPIVIAFDTDPRSRNYLRGLASENHVSERVSVQELCSSELLLQMDLGTRSVIISDCEGYELTLFTEAVVSRLAAHDVLIECHDFIKLDTTQILESRFEKSHRVEVIESVDDGVRAYAWNYPELLGEPLGRKHRIMAEGRPNVMRWLYCRANKRH